jgi:hypothetical protein
MRAEAISSNLLGHGDEKNDGSAARGRRRAPAAAGSRHTLLHGASPGRGGRWSIWWEDRNQTLKHAAKIDIDAGFREPKKEKTPVSGGSWGQSLVSCLPLGGTSSTGAGTECSDRAETKF